MFRAAISYHNLIITELEETALELWLNFRVSFNTKKNPGTVLLPESESPKPAEMQKAVNKRTLLHGCENCFDQIYVGGFLKIICCL